MSETAVMSVIEALAREIASAEEQDRPLLHIRVTTDAIPGSPASLPITPERARQVRLRAIPRPDGTSAGVDADPEVWLRALEITVHPEDWVEVLKDPRLREYGPVQLFDRFCGIRVTEGPSS